VGECAASGAHAAAIMEAFSTPRRDSCSKCATRSYGPAIPISPAQAGSPPHSASSREGKSASAETLAPELWPETKTR
jgi:hypothetical protein